MEQFPPIFTVIVPVFNGEKTIERCIDSILKQNISIEIFIINDGSTDETEFILSKFINDDNIKIINQKNKGVSASRNIGLNLSKGKFICFVDSDDYLPENTLSYYHAKMTDDLAMIIGSTSHVDSNNNFIYLNSFNKKNVNSIVDLISCQRALLIEERKFGVCDKVFLGEVIRRKNIEFDSQVSNFEDLFFIIEYLSSLNNNLKVLFSEKITYYYTESENSLTRSNLSNRHFSFIDKLLSISHSQDIKLRSAYSLNCLIILIEYISKIHMEKKPTDSLYDIKIDLEYKFIDLFKDYIKGPCYVKKDLKIIYFYFRLKRVMAKNDS